MRTLVYKRTHNGDPDNFGRFGIADCMGQVRSLDYEAVIGVGGQGEKAKRNHIARKLTWIGIGPHKKYVPGMADPVVTFDHFLYFGPDGDLLKLNAPHLAERMYVKKPRYVLDDFSPRELAEIEKLLVMAADAPPSQALVEKTVSKKRPICRPKTLRGIC
jgi:hypothetical protein